MGKLCQFKLGAMNDPWRCPGAGRPGVSPQPAGSRKAAFRTCSTLSRIRAIMLRTLFRFGGGIFVQPAPRPGRCQDRINLGPPQVHAGYAEIGHINNLPMLKGIVLCSKTCPGLSPRKALSKSTPQTLLARFIFYAGRRIRQPHLPAQTFPGLPPRHLHRRLPLRSPPFS